MENDIQKKQRTKTGEDNSLITATVVFGMPAKDCAYQGICIIEPEKKFREYHGRCVGLASISQAGENVLDFSFPKSKLNRKTIKKHFGSGYFIILEDYKIPDFLYQAIGKQPIVILQGIYKVNENETHLRLKLNIATL